MKKLLSIGILLLIVCGCSVTSEKYRYQWRFDRYYNLLNQEEKVFWCSNDLGKLGASFDKRLASDSKLSNSFHNVQIYEAITTFEGKETAVFFHDIILRELNKPVFYQFMNRLDKTAQEAFVRQNDFMASFDKIYQSNKDFKNFIDNLKKEYRLYHFSNEQIYQFFRTVSFPEVSRKELFHILKLLKAVRALDDFKAGNTKNAAIKLEGSLKNTVSTASEFNEIKKRSSMSNLETFVFLDVYYQVILKEMSPYAVKQTLSKF